VRCPLIDRRKVAKDAPQRPAVDRALELSEGAAEILDRPSSSSRYLPIPGLPEALTTRSLLEALTESRQCKAAPAKRADVGDISA
jgi:hypothetical protein